MHFFAKSAKKIFVNDWLVRKCEYAQGAQREWLVILVDEVDDHLHHDVLLLGAALGNHQREGDEGVICNTLATIRSIQDAMVLFLQHHTKLLIKVGNDLLRRIEDGILHFRLAIGLLVARADETRYPTLIIASRQ